MSNGTERLLGVETEYATAAWTRDGRPYATEAALRLLLEQGAQRPHLRAKGIPGVFFANASLLYLDGSHPELATAETTSPDEALLQIKAGEQLVHELAQAICGGPDIDRFLVSRTNVQPWPPATWACHESVGLRTDDCRGLARWLIPYLATRQIYTGSGGFDVDSAAGIRFLISPRVCFLETSRSPHSTQQRGIFHDKPDPLRSRKNRRLHILSGESLFSEYAIWLKLGAVACVTALAEAGAPFPSDVELVNPVAAMRAFAADPTLQATARVAGGQQRTALDIQYAYLEAVEQNAAHRAMPAWVDTVCVRWRQTLDDLSSHETVVTGRLDWAIRQQCFRSLSSEVGYDWQTLARWNEVFALLAHWGKRRTSEGSASSDPCAAGWRAASKATTKGERRRDQLRQVADNLGLDYQQTPALLQFRQQLFELDWRFGELGDAGIFAQLDRAGMLDHRLCCRESICQAAEQPPARGRARLRGEWISRLQGESDATCSWSAIFARRGVLDLSDPLAEKEVWIPLAESSSLDVTGEIPPAVQHRPIGCDARPRTPRRQSTRALFDRLFAAVQSDYDRGRYCSALTTLARLGSYRRLDRRRQFEMSRLRLQVRARAGDIDDEEFRIRNNYRSARHPPTLREINAVLYANRFGRLRPASEALGEWVEAGQRLTRPGCRLVRYEPRLVAEFRELLAWFLLTTDRIDEAYDIGRRLTPASAEPLLGGRRRCWAMLTQAAVSRRLHDIREAQRLVRIVRLMQRRAYFPTDYAEMTAPLATQLLIDRLPPRTSAIRVVELGVQDALLHVDERENSFGALRILRSYADLIGPDEPYYAQLAGDIARLERRWRSARLGEQQLLF